MSGVEITKLKKDTIVFCETENNIYELLILDPLQKLVRIASGERFKIPVEAYILGCIQDGECEVGFIVKGKCLEVVPVGSNKTITTSPIQVIEIIGPARSFKYEI